MADQETKTCKYCGSEIPANAKICPNCRKKQSHKVRNGILIGLGVILLLGILLAFLGRGNNSESTTVTEETVTEETDTTQQNYTVGSATLNSVTASMGNEFSTPQEGYEFLICNWTVTNNGSEEFNPFDFSTSGYVDGATVENAITGLPDQFDMGTIIIPGSSTTGNKIYEVPQGWQEFQIRAQIGTVGGESQLFTIMPDQVTQ